MVVSLYYSSLVASCFRYYWKVLHDENADEGVAFIGLNNPHLDPSLVDSADVKICPTIDNHLAMAVINDPDDVIAGVTYACTVEDAATMIPEIPDLGSLGLLN